MLEEEIKLLNTMLELSDKSKFTLTKDQRRWGRG